MILVHEVCFLVVVVVCVRMDNFGVMSVVNTIQLFVYFFTRALSLSLIQTPTEELYPYALRCLEMGRSKTTRPR